MDEYQIPAALVSGLGAFFAFFKWLIGVIREEAQSSRDTHEKVSSDHLRLISDQLEKTDQQLIRIDKDSSANREAFTEAIAKVTDNCDCHRKAS